MQHSNPSSVPFHPLLQPTKASASGTAQWTASVTPTPLQRPSSSPPSPPSPPSIPSPSSPTSSSQEIEKENIPRHRSRSFCCNAIVALPFLLFFGTQLTYLTWTNFLSDLTQGSCALIGGYVPGISQFCESLERAQLQILRPYSSESLARIRPMDQEKEGQEKPVVWANPPFYPYPFVSLGPNTFPPFTTLPPAFIPPSPFYSHYLALSPGYPGLLPYRPFYYPYSPYHSHSHSHREQEETPSFIRPNDELIVWNQDSKVHTLQFDYGSFQDIQSIAPQEQLIYKVKSVPQTQSFEIYSMEEPQRIGYTYDYQL